MPALDAAAADGVVPKLNGLGAGLDASACGDETEIAGAVEVPGKDPKENGFGAAGWSSAGLEIAVAVVAPAGLPKGLGAAPEVDVAAGKPKTFAAELVAACTGNSDQQGGIDRTQRIDLPAEQSRWEQRLRKKRLKTSR